MTFGTFSLNYTHYMSIHPLIWTWMFKVGPLPTFLSKKIKTFSEIFQCNEARCNLAEKLAQVKTILPWWANTISPIFFKFCVTFRFTWKWIETTKKDVYVDIRPSTNTISPIFSNLKHCGHPLQGMCIPGCISCHNQS